MNMQITMSMSKACVGGLREVFQSSTWTLTCRELHAGEAMAAVD
jgi:hypothetical protein